MTAQISDTFIFKGEEYSLIGMKGGDLASPEQFGMEPAMMHTACYRGFYASYELTEESLYLRELTLREKNGNYPECFINLTTAPRRMVKCMFFQPPDSVSGHSIQLFSLF